MRKLIFLIGIVLCVSSSGASQTPGFHLIFGNHDGSAVDVYLDDFMEIKTWLVTPPFFDLNGDSIQDTIGFVHIPLGSNDSAIVPLHGGIVYYPLDCYETRFLDPTPHSQPGYTNRSFLVFYDLSFPPLNCPEINTYDDTLNVFSFFIRTEDDSSLIGQTVCPFIGGFDPALGSVLLGLHDGVTAIIPDQTFSCLYFVEYLAGDANGSVVVDGLDVIYLVNYLKGLGPPPDPIFSGDANGDCAADGMDVLYLVTYLKGGPPPFLGSCH